jgi:(S)-ureidoglycine aminohydrolase
MRKLFFIPFMLVFSMANAQKTDSLISGVYHWDKIEAKKEETRVRRQILEGKTFALDYFEIHTSTIESGMSPHPPHKHDDQEELIIVKEGYVKITIGNTRKIVGPGSVGFAMPGDMHGIDNVGNDPATYFILKYKSKQPMDTARARREGGSFILDWNELTTTNTGKGYRRNFFDRGTSQLRQFEMHTTALNKDSVSHKPHTHIQEEIILIIRGNVEMQIGDKFYPAAAGDLFFISANVPHALRNNGKEQCEYFAFQWRN